LTQPASAGSPLLTIRGLTKYFGAVAALTGLDLDVRAGEVHALIGQNGSGKSTLIKSLSGYHQPDVGEITLHGTVLELPIAQGELASAGLAFLHQDAPVAPAMTVLENIRVGRYSQRMLGRISPRAERRRVRALLESVGLTADPDMPASRMPTAERAMLGFAAAVDSLNEKGGVLVLDEPTASLPPGAAKLLFDAVRRITATGSAVLFVSHRLDEIEEISDRVSVLRDGRLVGTVETAETNEDELVSMMLGRDLDEVYPDKSGATGELSSTVVLRAAAVTGRIVTDVAVDVKAGEIVGVTGLVGMGQDELPYLIYGALPMSSGDISINGESVRSVTPRELRHRGVALVPADRARASGALLASVSENLSLPVLRSFFIRGLLRGRREQANARRLVEEYDVRPPVTTVPLGTLSGGNQQKVLLAKWLQSTTALLMLHEPTLGVDIGSRAQIFSIVRAAADRGTAVLVASSEYEDLANICDRIIVLNHGRVVAELTGDRLTEEAILHSCFIAA
jgi:ribose transport system ATP-binding protein